MVDPTITTGSILQMKVNASGGTLLNGFDITIRWDQTVLNGTSVTTKGGLFDSPMFFLTLNETRADHVRLSGVLLGGFVPANATIISFKVKVLSQGSTPITIDTAATALLSGSTRVPFFPLQGFFSNSPGTGDLLLLSEKALEEQVTLGDRAQLTLGVQNIGISPMTNVMVTLFAYNATNNFMINSTVLPVLAGNTIQPVSLTWNTTGFRPGPYVMNTTVSTASGDAYLGDNTMALEQITLVIHELAIVSVSPGSPSTLIGSPLKITASVKNLGTVSEYATVTMYANDTVSTFAPISAECYNPPVPCSPSLTILVGPGAVQSQFNFQWNTSALTVGNYTLRGVVSVIPGERNVTNNVFTTPGYVTVFASFDHDLGVEWNPPNTGLYTGANYTFALAVTNNGRFNDSFTLTLFSNSTEMLRTTGTAILKTKFTTTFVWKTLQITPANYLLKLNVTDNSGLDQYTRNNTETSGVTVNANHSPFANFTFTPSTPKTGDPIFFNATLSRDPDTNQRIKYYIWDFGDGTGGSGNTTNNGKTITHTYIAAGSYTASLTVWDDYGGRNSLSKTVAVSPIPPTPGRDNSFILYLGIAAGVAAIGAGAAVFLMFRRRKKMNMHQPPKTTSAS
ncbi:hypothetical protein AUG19_07270 [archaeon 13_1_20CM_2_54_9]|nr:MAG: hypothetical protein AUJ07_00915 [Crenarchaeota archaeon 13_1_40CM_3_53_5]OLE74913.1 MAG: hypothetical protein AUG19_07270 [archaeon 13_1_20CM_2_54_9]